MFNYEDLPKEMKKALIRMSAEMLAAGEVTKYFHLEEMRGRIVTQFELQSYSSFEGIVCHAEVALKKRAYHVSILINVEAYYLDCDGNFMVYSIKNPGNVPNIMDAIGEVNRN